MKPGILLVEDDHIQRADALRAIESSIDVELTTKSTESEFELDFEAIAGNPPKVAVLDLMLRWARPAPEMPAASAEVMEHPEQAGLRCARRLLNDPRTRGTEVIVYSVFPREDFRDTPAEVIWVVKDPGFQNVLEKIREALARAC
jgi:CheY-like chemotaxis protein